MANVIGTVLRERYRVEAAVGEGGMGAVYLADDLRLPGRRCAVKQVSWPAGLPAAAARAQAEAFLHEAALLARLDHPALPKVSDYFESAAGAWLVMDYVAGQDLRAVLVDALSRRRQLDERQVVRWAEDACAALTYLHSQSPPIVHRDIKPANLKLTPDGQIKLVDFGLAHPVETADARTVTVLAGAGSRPYQPLEQYGDGAHVDARADVYALGATVYQLLTGHAPPSAQERFLGSRPLPPLPSLRPDVAPHVARAVMCAMALHPDDRPPSAEALRRLLTGVAGDSADGTPSPSVGLAAALRANAPLAALTVALLAAAIALTLW